MANDPLAQARQAGYERSDADSRSLSIFLVVTGIALIAVALAVAGFFKYLGKTDKPPAFLEQPFDTARPLPSGPRLQAAPLADIQEYRKEQQQLLNSYGWVDHLNGIAHMPIDQAMARVLAQGLPARGGAASTTEQSQPSENPPPSASGGSPDTGGEEATRAEVRR